MLQLRVDNYQTQEFLMNENNNDDSDDDDDDKVDTRTTTTFHRYPIKTTEIPTLILMVGKMDIITPMLTPVTYEGLLDDNLGMDCGFIHVHSHY